LTPVFFYVIDRLSGTRLFMAVATQWISAALLGAAMGAGIGFSLAQIGWADPTWAIIVGGSMGVLGGLLLQAIHRRVTIRERDDEPR
jgi:hypothetical protein